MWVSAVFWVAARCCNTANSLTIDGKFEIMNKRIGSVRNWKFITFNPALHIHNMLPNMPRPKKIHNNAMLQSYNNLNSSNI